MSDQPASRPRQAPPPPEHTRFRKGVSGNPSGMPKGVAEVRALARQHTPAAMAALVEVCTNRRAPPSARVSAATVLLDRGWGKAVQPVDIHDNRPLAGVPAERLVAALEALARAAGREEPDEQSERGA